ncbi:molecular chaperone TorD family protein [Halomarina pelagica]|uniref:molecular chaperone TorD family protein n=1 Tax=Halomarina pelagica TaxID=2961599 RepID=UPI0020C1F1A0|nr:molecular chaperone TorD family protein [Halomarina sp. BND7]
MDDTNGNALEDGTAPVDDEPLDVASLDAAAAARGGVYALFATLFEEPDETVYARLDAGEVHAQCADLLAATGLDVDPPDLTTGDDHETLCARYNDLFTVGYAEYEDRSDGSLASRGPPVSLYESRYRSDVSWSDVNLDLARAYDYFGLGVDRTARDNHDYLPYLLEFAGYLARRAALLDEGAARARLDFLDRHLRVVAPRVAERVAGEPGTDLYGELADALDRFTAADQVDLAARYEEVGRS